MSNTSATGGFLNQTEEALPGGLTLDQFIQQTIVNLTGMVGSTVRPKFQKNMPKVPAEVEDNWCAFTVTPIGADANPYQVTTPTGDGSTLQRHEELSIACSFYGPQGRNNARNLRDGFHIAQNRDVLTTAKMGFKEASDVTYLPELHGGVWFARADINIILRRQVNKIFAVLSFEGAEGTIKGQKDNNEIETIPWNVSTP